MSNEPVPASYSSWAVGWAGFAAIMLIIIGVLDLIQGVVALANDTFYVVGEEWVFEFNITTWGWIHIIVGIVLILAGVGIFSGNVLGRIVGVIVAVWSIIVIAICIAVIWALTAHGRDITYT